MFIIAYNLCQKQGKYIGFLTEICQGEKKTHSPYIEYNWRENNPII